MPRPVLKKSQIKELSKNVCEVFSFLADFKEQNPLAEHIQFPKTPTILSESLVRHLIDDRKILTDENVQWTDFGGETADIIVGLEGGQTLKVEVKGTATSAFQDFSEKDVTADYLVWVHLEDLFKSELASPIEVFVVKSPSNYFEVRRQKTWLRRFIANVGQNMQHLTLTLEDL